MIPRSIPTALATFLLVSASLADAPPSLKALIIDGQNNHGNWPKTTAMMKRYLEDTGLFSVDIARTQFTWQGADLIEQYPLPDGRKTTALAEPKPDPDFKPRFDEYDVVICNFGWRAAPWPDETKAALDRYLRGGGGLVIVHAADNAFGDWPEYNRMISRRRTRCARGNLIETGSYRFCSFASRSTSSILNRTVRM